MMRHAKRAVLVLGLALVSAGFADEGKEADRGAAAAGQGESSETLRLESSVVTGNRELPKVMSIVPWKKSQLGELSGRPSSSLLNEIFAPVDREVFRRQLRYYAALRSAEQEQEQEQDKNASGD